MDDLNTTEVTMVLPIAPRTMPIILPGDMVFIISFILRYIQCVILLLSNGVLLLAFHRSPHLLTSTGWLIVGLAVVDLTAIPQTCAVLLIAFYSNTKQWVYMCQCKMALTIAYGVGSIIFNAIIVMERLITLSYPLTYMTIVTPQRAAICTFVTWVFMVALSVGAPIINYDKISSTGHNSCYGAYVFNYTSHMVLSFIAYISVIVIFVSYMLIARIAWQKRYRPVVGMPESNTAQWKITKMMSKVFLLYSVVYIPFLIIDRIVINNPYTKIYWEMRMMTTVVSFLSSWVNPLFYFRKNEDIRRAICKVLPQSVVSMITPTVKPSTSNTITTTTTTSVY